MSDDRLAVRCAQSLTIQDLPEVNLPDLGGRGGTTTHGVARVSRFPIKRLK